MDPVSVLLLRHDVIFGFAWQGEAPAEPLDFGHTSVAACLEARPPTAATQMFGCDGALV